MVYVASRMVTLPFEDPPPWVLDSVSTFLPNSLAGVKLTLVSSKGLDCQYKLSSLVHDQRRLLRGPERCVALLLSEEE